jgi:hypothetical protein
VSRRLQHFLRLAGMALSSVGVLDYDADHGNELGILERGQNEQVMAVHSHTWRSEEYSSGHPCHCF